MFAPKNRDRQRPERPERTPPAMPAMGGFGSSAGASVLVNKRTVVHSKSMGIIICGPPDVCKTPTPGGPVPIPYPNIAFSKDLAKGTKSVKVDGVPVAIKPSEFAISTGDEAGTAGGGVISSKIKGKAKFITYSFDVKFEGQNVARQLDTMTMNGDSPNTIGPAEMQPPGFGLGPVMAIVQKAIDWVDGGKEGREFSRPTRERPPPRDDAAPRRRPFRSRKPD